MAVATAKVFINGRSQAIRLPRQFRVDTDEVFIVKEKERLVIMPKPRMTWKEFFASTDKFEDFKIDRNTMPSRERELF